MCTNLLLAQVFSSQCPLQAHADFLARHSIEVCGCKDSVDNRGISSLILRTHCYTRRSAGTGVANTGGCRARARRQAQIIAHTRKRHVGERTIGLGAKWKSMSLQKGCRKRLLSRQEVERRAGGEAGLRRVAAGVCECRRPGNRRGGHEVRWDGRRIVCGEGFLMLEEGAAAKNGWPVATKFSFPPGTVG